MGWVTIPGGLWIPRPYALQGVGAGGYLDLLIDATAEKAAQFFRVPKTGTLDTAEFRVGTVALNAGSVIRVSFQDPTNSSNVTPDGTQDQFRDLAAAAFTSNTWIVPGLMTSDGTDTGTKRSVTIGEVLCVVVEYQTFVSTSALRMSALSRRDDGDIGIHAGSTLNTGSWAGQGSCAPVIALKYNDGSYGLVMGSYPAAALNAVALNLNSTPDEMGLIFRFPAPVKIGGAFVRLAIAGGAPTTAPADVVLYDSDGTTALRTVSAVDKGSTGVTSGYWWGLRFSSEVALDANVDYRLVIKPTAAAAGVSAYDWTVNSQAILDALEGGQNWHRTERTNAGAWTQTTTKRPLMGLLVTAIDDGAGMKVHPGLVGGLRG
jgi:hypothetical protein